MVKFKYLALAAGLAFASPSFAANELSSDFEGKTNTSSTFSILSGTYNFGLSLVSSFGEDGGAAAAKVQLFSVVNKVSTLVKALQTGTFDEDNVASLSSALNLSAGTYSFKLTGSSIGGSTVATASLNTVTAVPGPEAGTGLAALAMAGVGAIAYRRKRLAA